MSEKVYGVATTVRENCENCGHAIEEHCSNDVADCIAAWRPVKDKNRLREKVHRSLRAALDYNAALALYWTIHHFSELEAGESWPWVWEQRAYDALMSNPAVTALSDEAGGWWWVAKGDPVFKATHTPETPATESTKGAR